MHPRRFLQLRKKTEKAVRVLKEALKEEEGITLHLLPDIYPTGEERAVVRECLGVELGVDQLPTAADAVVNQRRDRF